MRRRRGINWRRFGLIFRARWRRSRLRWGGSRGINNWPRGCWRRLSRRNRRSGLWRMGFTGSRIQNSEVRIQKSGAEPQMNADERRSDGRRAHESVSMAPDVVSYRGVWLKSDMPFFVALSVIGATYIVLIVAMLVADVAYTTPGDVGVALSSEPIQFAIKLSLFSCTV